MKDVLEDNLLIVCPNEEKLKILKSIQQEQKLYNIKFMTKEEYKQNYYFSYDEETISYLLETYHYHLDVCKMYLENLYVIDIEKNYRHEKLNFLKKLKLELLEKGLLKENPYFRSWIQTRKIIVKNYYHLEPYEEEMLQTKSVVSSQTLDAKVVEYLTMEDEINGVCLQIIELLKKGIDINHIYLTNITSDYTYLLTKIFAYYNIPLNLDPKDSIFSTKVVQDYLINQKLDFDHQEKLPIYRKLLSVLANLSKIEGKKSYSTLLIDQLKNTMIPYQQKKNAVRIKNLYNEEFTEDEYVFVLGFNQDILPKMEKDISYLSDSLKQEVPLYSTKEKNKRNKETLFFVLASIKNLFLSYKKSSPFQTFYPSSVISDFHLEVIKGPKDFYQFSNLYNKIRLAEQLDSYYLYGEKGPYLSSLYTHYPIPYKTYSNQFLGINKDTYLEQLPYPLKLSYTSFNAYQECRFKYYIKYVLKLENYEEKFANFIGSMYHEILSLYQKTGFDLEEEYQKYISKKELTLKEKLLLRKIKKELIEFIEQLKEQQKKTSFQDAYFEKKVEIPLKRSVEVLFTGYIDKIMYYKNIEDTYFSIIDYKTGTIDTQIEPMKYGLHMQLPIYLYLIHYSKVFQNPIFTGIYYQNILFPYPTWEKNLEKKKNNRYLLQGYSTDNTEILELFDSTYRQSDYIKSMSYQEEKGFGYYAKILSNDLLYHLITYTKDFIERTTDQILDASFSINPKIYAKNNISCQYCPFLDLCYRAEKDIQYLNKVDDLSFLGGEEE